ncbi:MULTISPECIES: hypothetical protein [Petrotoga]|uniref:Uncharacterized protein n=1 Tax=Petrotoga sibirica DSM 13575 TaxID=1122956 RepID=A0A855MRX9_9BACT|nr:MULTISPECIES: hypothetical protein [Petrotoga]POZ89279.1 hypothetical protein AA80_01235 [Petrotoga sibirica DSM 13575]POZ91051.1 hypothetical protein AD60_03520 [Petrotoga sp. SL27]
MRIMDNSTVSGKNHFSFSKCNTVRSRDIFIFLHSSSRKKDNKRDCSINDSRLKGFEDRVYNGWERGEGHHRLSFRVCKSSKYIFVKGYDDYEKENACTHKKKREIIFSKD